MFFYGENNMKQKELLSLVNSGHKTQEECKECLKIFYEALKKAPETDEYIWSEYSDNLSKYTIYIPYISSGLIKKDYESVCDIIQSILFFNNKGGRMFQKRDKYALLLLLEREFEEYENISKNT